ncbi:MAG TPA: hypothetical protein VIU82_26005 [Bosea sp. (in: a-proteobacteria)]
MAAIGGGLNAAGSMAQNRAKNRDVRTQAFANIQQMEQDSAAAKLRNKILNQYVGRQKEFTGQNQEAFKGGVGGYAAPVMEESRAGSEASRNDFLNKQIAGIPQTEMAVRDSDSPAVASELAKKMGEAFASTTAGAGRAAKLGSFGDSWTTAGEGAQDSARKIDTTNNFARGEIAMLPADQDLQEFVLRKPIYKAGANPNNPAGLLGGLGGLVGSLAGAYGKQAGSTLSGWFGGGGSGGSSNFGFASPTQRA